MNSLTETLNGWGGRFLEFAWPMLWQSSLLIALMIALDRVLRKKVRAAIRYSLWLVVLVKLILPPSLALPTSLAWWLRPSAPAPEPPRVTSMVFTRANLTIMAPRPMIAAPPALLALPTPKRAPMSPAAWALVGWSGVSLGLLGWLVYRWIR